MLVYTVTGISLPNPRSREVAIVAPDWNANGATETRMRGSCKISSGVPLRSDIVMDAMASAAERMIRSDWRKMLSERTQRRFGPRRLLSRVQTNAPTKKATRDIRVAAQAHGCEKRAVSVR